MCRREKNEWYVDSGASSHMTPNKNYISNVNNSSIGHIISANNAKLKVMNSGNVTLSLNENEMNLKNVLHVPELSANLLSVSAIASSGKSITFDKNGCVIRNSKQQIIAKCTEKNGTYKLNASVGMCLLAKKETAMTWHRRLAHINFQSMKRMRDGVVEGVFFSDGENEVKNCEVCQKGKQHRLSFKPSQHHTRGILELIHSDLMGPMEIQSFGQARFVLTFIDDYSRKVFVYF